MIHKRKKKRKATANSTKIRNHKTENCKIFRLKKKVKSDKQIVPIISNIKCLVFEILVNLFYLDYITTLLKITFTVLIKAIKC